MSRTEDGERFTLSKTDRVQSDTLMALHKIRLKEDAECGQHENSPSASIKLLLLEYSNYCLNVIIILHSEAPFVCK